MKPRICCGHTLPSKRGIWRNLLYQVSICIDCGKSYMEKVERYRLGGAIRFPLLEAALANPIVQRYVQSVVSVTYVPGRLLSIRTE